MKQDLPDTFLPYGQIGVRVPGGLNAAVHAVSYCVFLPLDRILTRIASKLI